MKKHLQSWQSKEALAEYFRLRSRGLSPSIRVTVESLRHCKKLKDLQTARRIHRDVRHNGDDSDAFVATALVDMYAECGSLAEAEHVFQAMQHKDVFAWTAMILGYAKLGQGELALQCYERMQEAGCVPDRVTTLAAIKACVTLAEREEGDGSKLKTTSLEKGRGIHSQAASRGYDQDLFVASSLVDMYSKCGCMESARQVFDRVKHNRCEVPWNSIILGYAISGHGDVGLELYARMHNEGCVLSSFTVVAALKACVDLAEKAEGLEGRKARLNCLEKGRAIHGHTLHVCGAELGLQVATTLVDLYTKCGSLTDALKVFEVSPRRDVTLWSCIILGCAHNGESLLALELYARMQDQGECSPDSTTLVAVLKACGSLAQGSKRAEFLEAGRRVHMEAAKWGMINSFVTSSLADMYAKFGRLADARLVFESSEHRDVVLWNCIIQGYADCGRGDVALQLYRLMHDEDSCSPDALTFVASLKACSSLGAIETGRVIHSEARRAGLDKDAFVLNSLVDLYGKCGSMAEAEQVFRSIRSRNLVTWSALICGYGSQGEVQRVMELFQAMQDEHVQPDDVTYLSVLAACSHAGLVDVGKNVLEEMQRKRGIPPRVQHYTCLVDSLGRANRLEEAVSVIKGMNCEANLAIWMALLAGCWRWKNVEVGELAFNSALQVNRKAASAYILMSNLYGSAGMWKEAGAVQNMRKHRCSKAISASACST